ncbi:hypothetical protein [Azospirillum doebereinerae]|uniref:PIN domain-containing protein n=1 Tax=Azospirillum doebereinerae TaxID=92933 RepID=A0A433IZB1_9PROT|nr:hypothetical protein [Azospirillum doebereinerae]RUQ60045.1 hypothetical protein EJ913_30860 [Azospirillum doebereinerae]
MIDTSAAINLMASGFASDIANAVPNRLIAVDTVQAELELGRLRGRPHASLLEQLVDNGDIHIVSLSEAAAEIFEGLVVGHAAETLDDGEAATLAYAIDTGAIPIIDERKANRICEVRFPTVKLGSTGDLFAHQAVVNSLGSERLSCAILNSLQQARMQVQPHFFEWVMKLIGSDQAAHCPSLPRWVRNRTAR